MSKKLTVVGNDDNNNNNIPAAATDEVSLTVKELLLFQENDGNLFDMTAGKHGKSGDYGKSISTTSQEKCVPVSGKNTNNDDDDNKKPAARAPKRKSQDENVDKRSKPFQSANDNTNTNSSDSTNDNKNGTKPTFVMEKWAPADFFEFLRKADSDLNMRRTIVPSANSDYGINQYWEEELADYKEDLNSTMNSQGMLNEGTLDSLVHSKINGLQNFVSQSLSALFECDIYIGLKSQRDNNKDPKNIGPDNSVDMMFSSTNVNRGIPAVVPWEHKVSWNYPGGSLTSEFNDYACLGRDVKLYELNERTSVPSFADYKPPTQNNDHETTNNPPEGSRIIENPEEGEDEKEIDETPCVKNALTEDNNVDSVKTSTAGTSASTSSTTGNLNSPPNCGKYKMKHGVFPVRQIVSYMLSFKSRYGILSTGYRFDFIKLEVVNKGAGTAEQLKVFIAGPLWSVGGLNERMLGLRSESEYISRSSYYPNIHRYSNNDEDSKVSILDSTWSTKIGDYSFREGLMRFMFAAAGMDENESKLTQNVLTSTKASAPSDGISSTIPPDQQQRPRSHMNNDELPSWYGDYTRKHSSTSRPAYQSNAKKAYDAYCHLCKGSNPFYFKNNEEQKTFLSQFKQEGKEDENGCILPSSSRVSSTTCTSNGTEMTESSHNELPILTKFGNLTLAELQQNQHETKRIGYGRIGEAFMTKLPDVVIAYKLLRRSEWEEEEDYEKRIAELQYEASIYEILKQRQGSTIPRFLYTGSLVDASYWIMPEHGEMIAFATTYEGESLTSCSTKGSLALTEKHYASVKEGLKRLHESGVVHCDLNLRNIVFDKNAKDDNCIKLIDFGNALKKDDFSNDDDWDKACKEDVDMLNNALHSFPLQSTEALPESSKELFEEKQECAPV